MTERNGENAGVDLLARLGFGMASQLMSEPRVLVDAHFQGVFFNELGQNLGEDLAGKVRAQIGLFHGLRDGLAAIKTVEEHFSRETGPPSTCPAVPIRLEGLGTPSEVEIRGTWCDAAEARAEASRNATTMGCSLTSGYVSGWLSGLFKKEIVAFEIACKNAGSKRCHFLARETAAWRFEDDTKKTALLDALPFELFRRALESPAAHPRHPSANSQFPVASAAHVWGPVMILPVAEPGEALRTIRAIAKRRDQKDVRAVVIDFPQRKAYSPSALHPIEAILKTVASWGAEPILANTPTALNPILDRHALGPYLTRPTLNEAVASAFQVVDAQKYLL